MTPRDIIKALYPYWLVPVRDDYHNVQEYLKEGQSRWLDGIVRVNKRGWAELQKSKFVPTLAGYRVER